MDLHPFEEMAEALECPCFSEIPQYDRDEPTFRISGGDSCRNGLRSISAVGECLQVRGGLRKGDYVSHIVYAFCSQRWR